MLPGQLVEVDVFACVHFPGVDLHDPSPGLFGWCRELDFPVKTSGPEEGGVQDIHSVRGSDHLDV